MRRRDVLKGVGAGLGAGVAAPAIMSGSFAQSAAEFPTKPISFILPWGPGTGLDLWHRALCDAAGKVLGQPVVLENKAGGSGTAAPATMAALAKPDGYTISHIPITLFRFPFMQKTTYDPLKDFTYIIHQSGFLFGTYVQERQPVQVLQGHDRVRPRQSGQAHLRHRRRRHLAAHRHGADCAAREHQMDDGAVHAGPRRASLGGHVMAAANSAQWWPLTDAGQIRVLVVWTENRNARLPDTPTLKELGLPFVFDSPFGIAGPKGMDPAIVKKLHDAFKTAMDDPKAQEIQKKYDFPTRYMDSAAYTKFVAEQVAEQKVTLEKLGLARKE